MEDHIYTDRGNAQKRMYYRHIHVTSLEFKLPEGE